MFALGMQNILPDIDLMGQFEQETGIAFLAAGARRFIIRLDLFKGEFFRINAVLFKQGHGALQVIAIPASVTQLFWVDEHAFKMPGKKYAIAVRNLAKPTKNIAAGNKKASLRWLLFIAFKLYRHVYAHAPAGSAYADVSFLA